MRQAEAFSVLKYYEAALTAFLLITGGLLKFALDSNSTPALRKALEMMGVAVCCVGLLAAAAAEHHRRMLREDIKKYFEALALPLQPDRLEVLKYGILVCLSIFMIGLAGWGFLLLKKL